MLKIYNSFTKKKELFRPIEPKQVKLYVCGMTVYDFCHIGHARSMAVFDMVYRFLEYLGYKVTYIRNITDIDDKIILRAQANREDPKDLANRFIQSMQEDFDALGFKKPTLEPRATEFIDPIIHFITQLIEKSYAYVSRQGDVLFNINQFKKYGQLSHRQLDELRVGVRVIPAEGKRDPLDFVLWKHAKEGEPQWPSPWGNGRPGWHIECSAMALKCLGESIDIHGGGMDLLFPHHENEIAQSEAVTGKKFVNTWMHVGFLQIDQQKMSKSLHNFVTIREMLKTWDKETIRYFLMTSHYRAPLNYSQDQMVQAHQSLQKFYFAFQDLPMNSLNEIKDSEFEQRFVAALCDDFNTPEALSVLFDLMHEINRCKIQDLKRASALGDLLKKLGSFLGILQQNASDFLKSAVKVDTHYIEEQIQKRIGARNHKNWAEADRIRKELLTQGIILEDKPDGTATWRQK